MRIRYNSITGKISGWRSTPREPSLLPRDGEELVDANLTPPTDGKETYKYVDGKIVEYKPAKVG